MKIYISIISFLLVFFIPINARHDVQQVVVSITTEHVGDTDFSYTYKLADGVKHEEWKMDGQPVDKKAYEEALLDAEREERRKERERRYQDQEHELSYQQAMQRAVLHKVLDTEVQNIESLFGQMTEYGLSPFAMYTDQTLTSNSMMSLPIKYYLKHKICLMLLMYH